MKLKRLLHRKDSTGDIHPSAVWGTQECPGLQVHKAHRSRGGGWYVVLDRSVEGPVPDWVERLAEQGHASAKGLVLLFPGKRFARLGDAQAALEQAKGGAGGDQVLSQLL